MHYISTNFGFDSIRHFAFRAQTVRQTHRQTNLDATGHPSPPHATANAFAGNYSELTLVTRWVADEVYISIIGRHLDQKFYQLVNGPLLT